MTTVTIPDLIPIPAPIPFRPVPPPAGGIEIDISRHELSMPVYLFKDLGQGFREDASGISDELQRKVGVAFRKLKNQIAPDQNLKIDIDHRIVWLEDGATLNLNELMEQNPDIKRVAEEITQLADQVWPNQTRAVPAIKEGCKSSSAAPAMQRSFVTQRIPTQFSECAKLALELYSKRESDPLKQEAAVKRIAAIEKILNPQQKIIHAELELEKSNLNSAAAGDAAGQSSIRQSIAELQKYEGTERLGLYVAAAFAASIERTNAQRALTSAEMAAKAAREVLQDHVDEARTQMLKQNPFVPKEEGYSVDAAALVFSALPPELARKGATTFWQRNNSAPKKDGIEDELIRLSFAKELQAPLSATNAIRPMQSINTPQLQEMFLLAKHRDVSFAVADLKALVDDAATVRDNAATLAGETMAEKIAGVKAQHNFTE